MTIQKFVQLVKQGWSLDHIYILENIEDIPGLINFPRGAALLQTLFRKGMIDDRDRITQQGKELLKYAQDDSVEMLVKTEKPRIEEGLEGLHKKLQDKIFQLTGKTQKSVSILGSKYYFLCGKEDLIARIKKVMVKYKLSDYQAIEDTLIRYIEECHKRNNWSPLLHYYIIKQKEGVEMSPMVTALRSGQGKEEITKTDFEI